MYSNMQKRFLALALALLVAAVRGENPYQFFEWKVTYGDISPLGVKQQGILINGEFPGPEIDTTTNNNVIINVINGLPEPFLLSWNGIFQRKNSWQDGVYGTNCPIPPGKNYTYVLQMKDQIGTFFYFPSLAMHKAAGGFGSLNIANRMVISVPFPTPAGDVPFLIGDWFAKNHTDLKARLDMGDSLPAPDGLLINGRKYGRVDTVTQGKTYRLRIANVGLKCSLNFRIQGHKMTLVEVEGTYSVQNTYDSIDIHVGQSLSVLVTADQPPRDYYVVVSTRFASPAFTTTSIIRYSNSVSAAQGILPGGPPGEIDWSLEQARSIRQNLTTSGPRPNPQGSYHYGMIPVSRTIRIQNSAPVIDGKQRYAANNVSFVPADTPLKLADYYRISGVFSIGSIPDSPTGAPPSLKTAVMGANYRDFLEIIFENPEDVIQSWHISGYNVFVVGMDGGLWSSASRKSYNLADAIYRSTVQVYPRSWTAILMSLDNVGMWNIRSQDWEQQYLGQQFYLRVYTPVVSFRDENPIPANVLLCGKAATAKAS